jgi:hypothetical protein
VTPFARGPDELLLTHVAHTDERHAQHLRGDRQRHHEHREQKQLQPAEEGVRLVAVQVRGRQERDPQEHPDRQRPGEDVRDGPVEAAGVAEVAVPERPHGVIPRANRDGLPKAARQRAEHDVRQRRGDHHRRGERHEALHHD